MPQFRSRTRQRLGIAALIGVASCILLALSSAQPPRHENGEENSITGARLILHGALKSADGAKTSFQVEGDAQQGMLGEPALENNGSGIRLISGIDRDEDGVHAGVATCRVTGVQDEPGRWYRVRIRGLANDQFAVMDDDLYLKVEFFKDSGKNSLDFIKKSIYPQIERERKLFVDNRTNKNLGRATWRNYSIDVRTPFPDVDTLAVSVGFGHGVGKGKQSEFWVLEVEVQPIPDPAAYASPVKPSTEPDPPAIKSLVKLGGRWYYDPHGGDRKPPAQFDHANADRLYYLTDRLETPFVGNMSAWLRRGYLDLEGIRVDNDQFVPDAVTVSFTDKHLVMKSKNLPNHPTAVFPDRSRFLDGNPNVIREQRNSWYIPLDPQPNPDRPAAITQENKRGLPMGPIGVAVNGVVFFNPFDQTNEVDAIYSKAFGAS